MFKVGWAWLLRKANRGLQNDRGEEGVVDKHVDDIG